MKKVAFAALAGLSMSTCALSTCALAADAAMPVSGSLATNAQYEVGSGWYLRGDLGDNLGVSPSVDAASITAPPAGNATTATKPTFGASTRKDNFSFGLGFGYQFAPWFRMDATFDHFTAVSSHYTGTVVCPYNARTLTAQAGDPRFAAGTNIGILYDTNQTCNGEEQITNINNLALINAYYDLPAFAGLVPYVGAGAGLNFMSTTGNLVYKKTSDGSTYAADLTAPSGTPSVWVDANGNTISPNPGISFAAQNWNRTYSQSKVTLAIALMAGVAYHFNESLALDLGYRYLNADILHPSSNHSHDFRAGIRLYAN